MKIFLTLIFLTFSSFIIAQKNETKYKTDIGSATKVIIEGGVTKIMKADTVIVKIYNEESGKKSKIFLDTLVQERDSLGNYISILSFQNPNLTTFTDISIKLKFSNPYTEIIEYHGNAIGLSITKSKDMMSFEFSALQLISPQGLFFKVTSRKQSIIEISGISGKL